MKIKNWAKHQHFKDRKPPWIKLYRDILDDIEWSELDGDDAKTLVMLWLIASENSGELPDVKTLAFRLRKSTKDVEKQLSRLSKWLISERYQDDINVSQINSVADIETPLRDRDRDRDRGEKEKETDAPEGVSPQVWQDFKKSRKTMRAAITQSAIDGIKREADKAGWSLEDALRECCARGWRGFKAEWVADKETPGKQQKTFAERDREAGMARWEEMTGRVHPDRQKTQTGQIIDVTPSLLEIGQ